MKPFHLAAPAKVNLILEVRGKRPDGYHELRTVMHTLELSDRLDFIPGSKGLLVTTDHAQVPAGEGNLVHRAAVMLAKAAGREPNVRIHITKRIPVAAGLGGGSSDAATALLGLCRLWRWQDSKKLQAIAKDLGSDVPFFLKGGCALGIGRGERIYPWMAMPNLHIALVNPGFPVPTALVYKNFKLHLTRPVPRIKMTRLALSTKNVEKIGQCLVNDLETVTEIMHPKIREMKLDLLACGASAVLMSGSGPTVFGLLPSARVGQTVKQRLSSKYPTVIITRTST